MSTATERPTLPNGWEWLPYNQATRSTDSLWLKIRKDRIEEYWHWRANISVRSWSFEFDGTAPDASSAAEAAERAVVDWARGLIKETDGC